LENCTFLNSTCVASMWPVSWKHAFNFWLYSFASADFPGNYRLLFMALHLWETLELWCLGYTTKMSCLGLAPAASKAVPLLPNLQRSPVGTTFPSSVSSRHSNRRKSRTQSIQDGGVSGSKKHNQSVRQGKIEHF
jgi:hypothetical protein